jgi:hypothetical protein
MHPVTVQFLKYPGSIHWGYEASYLGEDEHGDWIALPAGSRRWKGAEVVSPTLLDAVFCAPRDGWWHLHYSGITDMTYSHFVDIATPPVWVGDNRYEMIDLDLDVAVRIDGEVVIEDEDEFQLHQVIYGYPREMIDRARSETDLIVDALRRREEPFFEVADSWLARLRDAFA